MKFSPSAPILTSLAILFLAASCAKHDESIESLPSLPRTWVQGSGPSTDISEDIPSPEATKSVQAAFRVHSAALDEITMQSQTLGAATISGSHPPDWVPWHFDGMIGSFAVDVGGVFGALVGDGSSGVKITWQKQASIPRPPRAQNALKRASYHFNASMTAHDVSAMVEPTVRMAVATHSVRDAAALRRNLTAEGTKFLSVVRILSHVRPMPGWHIGGFQLGLFFSASGNVSPQIGLGGNVALYFDWQVPGASAAVALPALAPNESLVEKNLTAFVQSLSTLIAQAAAGASEFRKDGFEFQVFQIGLGVSVGGSVGIASAQTAAVGRIVFKSDAAANALAISEPLSEPMDETLNLIMPAPTFPASALSTAANPEEYVVPIEAKRFRYGIQRALKMGSFFARQAAAVDSPTWKTNEIELAFDTNMGGDLSLATVQGVGLIRIAFERVEK